MTDKPSSIPDPSQRPNPAVEATRRDDERDREIHQQAEAAGAGVGCLGIALIPWVAVIIGILAALVFVLIKKGW